MRLELHLTYGCNLACRYCNRASNFPIAHTPPMTIEQIEEAVGNTPALERIILVGGEPTLHPDIVRIAEYCVSVSPQVRIFSNGYSEKSREIIGKLERMGIPNDGGDQKLKGSVDHSAANGTIMQSPADCGFDRTHSCEWAGTRGCGYSVDSVGVTACSIGGMIDGLLRLGLRENAGHDPKRADADQLRALCKHCGSAWPFLARPTDLYEFRGHQVTRTWRDALERWTNEG